MIRDVIRDIVSRSAAALMEQGDIPSVALPSFAIDRPPLAAHGDYATNLALKLAASIRAEGQAHSGATANPRALAEAIAARMRETVELVPAYDLVERVEVAAPGFINLFLRPEWLLAQAGPVIAAGNTLGCIELGRGHRINLEFVSANPTGQATIGNGRGAFIGDTLGNVLRAAGFAVTKEYYFNDAGNQIETLGRSMAYYLAQALGRERDSAALYASLPEDESGRKAGYFGPYYEVVARALAQDTEESARLLALPDGQRAAAIGRVAAARIMADIRQTMAKLHVEFDVWFNQADLETSGAVESSIETLRALGFVDEREGAIWARTTAFGDDKDRVLVRSSGDPTYFASDVAYMRDKFSRGHDALIYVLGPDHHGYIGRLRATAGVLGHALDDVRVLLYQLVTLKVEGETVKMSKRLGNMVTLDELAEDVGADVTRFFYLMRANDTPLDFDLSLARQQTDENPGLSVQYAHARAAGVLRKALDQGISQADYAGADMRVLAGDPPEQREYELALMRHILRLEEVVERIALSYEPHHLTRYAMDLSDAFHLFYDNCPILKAGTVISPAARDARLRLLRAGQVTLARTLTLIGMSVPERMEREVAPAQG